MTLLEQLDAAAGDLLPDPLPSDPFPLFASWFERARAERIQANPNGFTLATVDADGRPSARVVLCKGIDVAVGSITFYTNYEGRKGRELDAHPEAAACFWWDALELQARLEGIVERIGESESDAYFQSRPWLSRIGAWASDQSRPIASRRDMLARVVATMRRFGLDPDRPPLDEPNTQIPRPPHWGGFRLTARRVELWISGAGRVHDRAEWSRELPRSGGPDPWRSTRLQP